MTIYRYNNYQNWVDILNQDADAMRTYYSPNAWVNWYNTNERFTVEEFIMILKETKKGGEYPPFSHSYEYMKLQMAIEEIR